MILYLSISIRSGSHRSCPCAKRKSGHGHLGEACSRRARCAHQGRVAKRGQWQWRFPKASQIIAHRHDSDDHVIGVMIMA